MMFPSKCIRMFVCAVVAVMGALLIMPTNGFSMHRQPSIDSSPILQKGRRASSSRPPSPLPRPGSSYRHHPYHYQHKPSPSTRTKTTTCLHAAALAQYAGQAIGLFNNMKTPASIIAGAIVPLGFLAPLQLKSEPNDTLWERRVRKLYQVCAVVTLATELIAVMWATVATNQLTENVVAPAESVWHLLQRDYELEWAAVNTHFVVGMLGFLAMIGSRAYFMSQKGLLGRSLLGIALSGLALMVSIVNRGVAAGGGSNPATGTAMRYGATILALGSRYLCLLLRRASSSKTFGPVELLSIATLLVSLAGATKAVWQDKNDNKEGNGSS